MNSSKTAFARHPVESWLALLLVLSFVLLSIQRQRPPDATSIALAPTQFSSGRALEYLKALTTKPHPIGSPEEGAVRDYIFQELSRLGLDPAVQRTTAVNEEWGDAIVAGKVQNIVARLKGTDNSKAVMLVAHYDSVPNGFGASDDGTAVAALLEVARALKAGTSLKNDVIFLFTDGEECGLLGAKAFVNEHPWAKDVGIVANFEARGNSGPVYMFETSPENGWLIKQFSESAPRPFASSLMYDIYRMLSNKTDFTSFRAAGLQGFNFAFIGGQTHYHTRLDSYEEVDERSLQHHGANALALVHHFGELNLNQTRGADAVYFDLLGETLVHYSKGWVVPLMLFAYILLFVVLLLGLRRKQISVSGMAFGFLTFLLNLICSVAIVSLIWMLVRGFDRESIWMPESGPYEGDIYVIGFVLLTLAITSAVYLLLSRKISLPNLMAGALLWWVIAATLSGLLLQGGSYLFVWPLLFTLVGWGVVFVTDSPAANSTKRQPLLLSLCALPGVIFFTELAHALTLGFGVNVAVLIVILEIFLLGLLLPHLDFLSAKFKWWLPGTLALIGVALLAAACAADKFDRRHPKPNSIFYALNADENKAAWISLDEQTDKWTSQFIPPGTGKSAVAAYVPRSSGDFLNAQAPVAQLASPLVELLGDETSNGVRKLRLHLASPRQAQVFGLYLDKNASVLAATVEGKPIAVRQNHEQGEGWGLRYYGLEPQGIELTLEVRSSSPLGIAVTDTSYGLPSLPGFTFQPRPDDMMPSSNSTFIENATVLKRSYSF
jgi:hypothetical protein